MDLIEAIE